MTGFGRGEASLPAKKITVEIRSLNSKQLDLSVRMPSAYRQLEFDIRSVVQRTLQRGKVDLNVAVESSTVEGVGTINREIFRSYLQQSVDALSFSGIDADYDALVPAILRMPGVISSETETLSDEERAALMSAVDEATSTHSVVRRATY